MMTPCVFGKIWKLVFTILCLVILLSMAINISTGSFLFGSRTSFEYFFPENSHIKQNENGNRFSSDIYVDNQFLINTSGCKIPDINPFHPSVKAYLKLQPKVRCKFTFIGDVTTSKINQLFFYPEKLPLKKYLKIQENSSLSESNLLIKKINIKREKGLSSDAMTDYFASSINCCYKYVTRVTHWNGKLLQQFDSSYILSDECYSLSQTVTVMKHDCIAVYCSSSDELIYKNVHHLVIRRASSQNLHLLDTAKDTTLYPVLERNVSGLSSIEDTKKANKKLKNRLSVIIFGTDSISRLNFLRNMPKTHKYLMENLEALEFRGFNKIGDNSLPNLLPILIGLSIEEFFRHPCMPRKFPNTFDSCPWIWKEFKKMGYTTAYMEDSSSTGTFNQNHSGFLIPPTDYYGRPYYIASEHLIANTFYKFSSICLGNRYNIKVLHDFSVEFMQAFSEDKTFSLFWSSSITHDFMESASLVDEPHAAYLKSLNENGALNTSVLIFLSDHGMRYGQFRETDIGTLEERLPMFYMVFPKWFKTRYPTAFSNLKKNTKSLTANFDIHETLLDVIFTRYKDEQYLKSPVSKANKGISLFKEIPNNRTCEDAGIHPHFCTCHEMEDIDKDDPTVLNGAKYTMDFVNKQLEGYENCLTFTNVSVLRSELSKWSRRTNLYIFLQLQLEPGNAIFETTIRNDLQFRRESSEVLGEISRIDSYGNQSHCIDHLILRKYCICKDIPKN